MQDRYAGDIGDFGKFHLLRTLFKTAKYNLKQVWYMYPNETHNNDGLHINYFDKVKGMDSELEGAFKNLVQQERNVKALEAFNLLSCEFFSEYVNKDGKDDLPFRKTWLQRAVSFAKKADFVFVDPDNGLATKLDKSSNAINLLGYESFAKRSKAGKYIFMDELRLFYDVSRCVVVYHHLNRTMGHDKQIEKIQANLKEEFFEVFAIKHKPYSPRVYFFVLKDRDISDFSKSHLLDFQKAFSEHWEFYP